MFDMAPARACDRVWLRDEASSIDQPFPLSGCPCLRRAPAATRTSVVLRTGRVRANRLARLARPQPGLPWPVLALDKPNSHPHEADQLLFANEHRDV